MSSHLRTFLQKPHPLQFNGMSMLIPGAVVFLLLAGLQPFGFKQFGLAERLAYALFFAVFTSGFAMSVYALGTKLLPSLFDEERWTLGAELATSLAVVSALGFLNAVMLHLFELSDFGKVLWPIVGGTFVIGAFPVSAIVLYEQHTLLHAQLRKAQELQKEMNAHKKNTKEKESTVFLHDENNKPELQVSVKKLLFLKAAGNYVEVFYEDKEGKLKKDLLRHRLKHIHAQVPENMFFHCHRSYVVNLSAIEKIDGNARNLTLILRTSSEQIPVSRNKVSPLKSLLSA
jgi:hypothetical protein